KAYLRFGLELHQHINIAVIGKIFPQHRTKERESAYVVAATEILEYAPVWIQLHLEHLSSVELTLPRQEYQNEAAPGRTS
ncbi:MAG: hypothetical protein R6U36_10950, partial [Candidatus Fermentibacteraceae bacterium]